MKKAAKPPQNKLMRFITMPIRALAKARDFYVKSMNNYADKISYSGASLGSGTAYVNQLPKSFSTNSYARSNNNDNDFNELVRAASTSTLANRINLNHPAFSSAPSYNNNINNHTNNSNVMNSIGSKHNSMQMGKAWEGGKLKKGLVPRSASVGMAKIEEDTPYELSEINGIISNNQGIVDHHKNDHIQHGVATAIKDKFRLFPRSKSYAVSSTKRAPVAAVF